MGTIYRQRRDFGWPWQSGTWGEFFIRLVISVLVTGLLGGFVLGRVLWALRRPRDHAS